MNSGLGCASWMGGFAFQITEIGSGRSRRETITPTATAAASTATRTKVTRVIRMEVKGRAILAAGGLRCATAVPETLPSGAASFLGRPAFLIRKTPSAIPQTGVCQKRWRRPVLSATGDVEQSYYAADGFVVAIPGPPVRIDGLSVQTIRRKREGAKARRKQRRREVRLRVSSSPDLRVFAPSRSLRISSRQ